MLSTPRRVFVPCALQQPNTGLKVSACFVWAFFFFFNFSDFKPNSVHKSASLVLRLFFFLIYPSTLIITSNRARRTLVRVCPGIYIVHDIWAKHPSYRPFLHFQRSKRCDGCPLSVYWLLNGADREGQCWVAAATHFAKLHIYDY